MANESFTFDYNNKYGVELEFRPRCKDNSSDLYKDLTGAIQEKTPWSKAFQISKQQIINEEVYMMGIEGC